MHFLFSLFLIRLCYFLHRSGRFARGVAKNLCKDFIGSKSVSLKMPHPGTQIRNHQKKAILQEIEGKRNSN